MALSAEEGNRLVGLLTEHAERITEGWTDRVTASMRNRLSRAELHQQVQEVHRGLLLLGEDPTFDQAGEHGAELRAVLSELSRLRARQGFTATETALSILSLKDTLADLLGDSDLEALRSYRAYSQVIDQLALYTVESYTRAREELIADQAEQLLELSTPVVKLWEGVVAVPLVGTLDSARAQVVMERLLQTLVDTGSPYAIIDITGVPAVDTQVAQHLLKTVVAARLMGADCIISGIRPQIAQTIVALGIEFGDIATKASLADALRHALRQTGVEFGADRAGRPDGARSRPADRRDPARLHPGRHGGPDGAEPAGGPRRPDRRSGCERGGHRHHRGRDRRLLRRPDAGHDRLHLPAARRRDRGGRHAARGGDHAGGARAVAAAASGPRSTSRAGWSCSPRPAATAGPEPTRRGPRTDHWRPL